MFILPNKYLPLPGFSAINLFGVVFVRRGTRLSPQLLRHERIHTAQQWELLVVGFYLWYVAEWLVRLAMLRQPQAAYRAISFEREAYLHQQDDDYLLHRRHFAWCKLL